MDDTISWLIYVFNESQGTVIRCALKVNRDRLMDDAAEYPMEPESRKSIHALLPEHIQSYGPIIAVDHIDDVVILTEEV